MYENSNALSVYTKMEAILDLLKDNQLLYKSYFAVLIVISN